MANIESIDYKSIIENFPESIVILDDSQGILYANSAFFRMSGYDTENIKEKKLVDLFDVDTIKELLSTSKAEMKNHDDSLIQVRITHSLCNGLDILAITALSDITALDQAHIDFVSTVSHELRTPLTSIKGFTETLLSSGDKLNKEQQQKFLTIIKSQIERLTRLVENLLAVTKLETKKDRVIYKAVNFSEFIRLILQAMSIKTKNHKIMTSINPNLSPIWADSDKLEQIFINLVDNAAKYSNAGTVINISADFMKNDSDLIEISVKDQGIGIPKEYLNKIFTKFSRIDNPLTRQVQGTGLGLYITKSLTESIGGKISVSSSSEGTTFKVILPVASPERHAAQKFMEEKR